MTGVPPTEAQYSGNRRNSFIYNYLNYPKGQAVVGLTFFYFRAKIISILWHEVAVLRSMSTFEFYF